MELLQSKSFFFISGIIIGTAATIAIIRAKRIKDF